MECLRRFGWFLIGPAGPVILSAIGAVLLGLSFIATSSDMSVTTGDTFDVPRGAYEPYVALCVGQTLVTKTVLDGGNGLAVTGPCPNGEQHPIAEVTRESSRFFLFGWLAVIVSTIWQIYLVTRPQPPAV